MKPIDYNMAIRLEPGAGLAIPDDVRATIVKVLNPITDGGIADIDFRGKDGRFEYCFPYRIGNGRPVEEYAEELAAAVRAIPGCGSGGEYGVKIDIGHEVTAEYQWIDKL